MIYVEAGDEAAVLACFEEGLRHGGLGAVFAELARLSMTRSRRLQLAAGASRRLFPVVRGMIVRNGKRIAPYPLYATRTAPTAIRQMPSQFGTDNFSPRKMTANTATITTLSLSIGATRAASPSFSARK